MTLITTMDILEYELKRALGSTTMNKVREGELFQILKDDVVKVLHLMYQ